MENDRVEIEEINLCFCHVYSKVQRTDNIKLVKIREVYPQIQLSLPKMDRAH